MSFDQAFVKRHESVEDWRSGTFTIDATAAGVKTATVTYVGRFRATPELVVIWTEDDFTTVRLGGDGVSARSETGFTFQIAVTTAEAGLTAMAWRYMAVLFR